MVSSPGRRIPPFLRVFSMNRIGRLGPPKSRKNSEGEGQIRRAEAQKCARLSLILAQLLPSGADNERTGFAN